MDFLDLCSHEVVIVAMNLRIDYSLPVIYCTRHMYARPEVKDTYSGTVRGTVSFLAAAIFHVARLHSDNQLACSCWGVVGGDK